MKPFYQILNVVFISVTLFFLQACATPTDVPTTTAAAATKIPLSQQVTLTFISFNEAGQAPIYSISAKTPMFAGSTDPRAQVFNQAVSEIIQKEIAYFRENVLAQMSAKPVSTGSSFEAQYELIFQHGDIWSLRFNFSGYADGAAHPYHYSKTYNYDLEQGQKISIGDLFPVDSKYLQFISRYCIAELSKRDIGFYGGFEQGADPTPDNYRNWNITSDGLLITFDEYQVAPYAAGSQIVTVPYTALHTVINPKGLLAAFTH